ncbi:unnamed protein product [Soboliphyme baturini]|uniref:Peptidase_M56 domain-containing protein n=1 Tax=Soboliphyme baturini TaxID=241478 RepID=A0A183J7N2_9BILA|nr:unnamed protein product [Soboliphyme baturini]
MILSYYNETDIRMLQQRLLDNGMSTVRKAGQRASTVTFRCLALLLFTVYMILSIWSCSLTEIHLSQRYLLPWFSRSYEFLENHEKYFYKYSNHVEIVFPESVDYHDPLTKASILSLTRWLEQDVPYVKRVICWLKDFDSFDKNSFYTVQRDSLVTTLASRFFNQSKYKHYQQDILIDPEQNRILQTR